MATTILPSTGLTGLWMHANGVTLRLLPAGCRLDLASRLHRRQEPYLLGVERQRAKVHGNSRNVVREAPPT